MEFTLNTRVMRASSYIKVDDKWFHLHALANAAFNKVKQSGYSNAAFHAPPFFYTGSPYGDAILELGVEPIAEPVFERIECVPQDRKMSATPTGRPHWPQIFNVDPSLAYDNW